MDGAYGRTGSLSSSVGHRTPPNFAAKYDVTVRCFDFITCLAISGCVALAELNGNEALLLGTGVCHELLTVDGDERGLRTSHHLTLGGQFAGHVQLAAVAFGETNTAL